MRDDHALGRQGEHLAAKVLKAKGYKILAQGHRQRLGEIDLVALDGPTVVFVEVKTRESDRQGDPADAVDRSKQEKLTRAALIYLKRRNLLEQPCRFDVISIVWPQLMKTEPDVRHIIHAFEAAGPYRMFH
ncbi:MAG: YraN family protein [Pirellulales bacterium]